jgi:hypothetical protein
MLTVTTGELTTEAMTFAAINPAAGNKNGIRWSRTIDFGSFIISIKVSSTSTNASGLIGTLNLSVLMVTAINNRKIVICTPLACMVKKSTAIIAISIE